MFSKILRWSRSIYHSNLMKFYAFPQTLDAPLQVYGQSYKGNLIDLPPDQSFALILEGNLTDLPPDESFALMLSYSLRKQLNPFFTKGILPLSLALYESCFNKKSQIFLVNSIVPSLFKGITSRLKQFLTIGRPLKLMKNVFYFMLKSLFLLEIFTFLL